jgi:hypothetical protein
MQFEDIRHQMGAVREEHERERKWGENYFPLLPWVANTYPLDSYSCGSEPSEVLFLHFHEHHWRF